MILLDTHTWIWLSSDPQLLSAKALKAVSSSKRKMISSISLWEFSMLAARGRLTISLSAREWMEESLREHKIEVSEITPAIAVLSTSLGPEFHGDPADRIICATALSEAASLVTKDSRIRSAKIVETIW